MALSRLAASRNLFIIIIHFSLWLFSFRMYVKIFHSVCFSPLLLDGTIGWMMSRPKRLVFRYFMLDSGTLLDLIVCQHYFPTNPSVVTF